MTELVTPAPLSRRFAAALYDSLLLVALLLSSTWFSVMARDALQVSAEAPAWSIYCRAMYFGIGIVFFGWSWTRDGQTLGMLAWRLRVRREDGAKLRWPVAAVRYAGLILCWAVALTPFLMLGLPATITGPNHIVVAAAAAMLTIIGIVSALADGRRRAPHDRLSGSEVVLLPRRSP